MVLDFSKDQGPDLATCMHKRISALSGSADRETRHNLLKLVRTPASEELSSKANAQDPRVILKKALPYGFFPSAKLLGRFTEKLRISEQATEPFYYRPAAR